MAARRLQQALANTLHALNSRYSDFDGWYLWGVVLRDAPQMTISLCSDALNTLPPLPRAVARNVQERLLRQLRLCPPPVYRDLVDVTVMLSPKSEGVLVSIVAMLSTGARVECQRVMHARLHHAHELRSVRREPTTSLRTLQEWLSTTSSR